MQCRFLQVAVLFAVLALGISARGQESLLGGWEVHDLGSGTKPSIDFAADGRIHAMGMTELNNGVIWHAAADSVAGPWKPKVVDTGYFYGPGDIRVDANGSAHIAIHDHDAQNALHIEVSSSGLETVARYTDTPNTHDGWDNSLAFDSNGRLVQASVDPSGFGATDSLVVSRLLDGKWEPTTVQNGDSFMYGFNTSIASDMNGDLHVLYTAADDWYSVGDLRHAFQSNGRWEVESVASGGIRGRFPTLAFDAENRAHAAWLDIDENDINLAYVRYAIHDGQQWSESTITTLENVTLGFRDGRKQVSLALDNSGNPRVASGDMRVVNYSTLNDGEWKTDLVLDAGVDRYNGLVVLRTNPVTNDPAIAFWEPDGDRSGTVRVLSRKEPTPLIGDVNHDGVLDAADIDAIARQLDGPVDLAFDINDDGSVNSDDYDFWVTEIRNVYRGDANLDGQFDSGDLVAVFGAAKYEDGQNQNAGWAEGDWNGDRDFNSTDLVAAFADGGYDQGPRPAPVPEPNSSGRFFLALLLISRMSRRRRDRSETSVQRFQGRLLIGGGFNTL